MRGSLECLNADRKEPAGRERRKNWPSGKKSRLPVEGFSCITNLIDIQNSEVWVASSFKRRVLLVEFGLAGFLH